MKPVAFRMIAPLAIKEKKSADPETIAVPEKTDPVSSPEEAPKLIIGEFRASPVATASFSALSKIRQEVVNRKTAEGSVELKPLETATLIEVWNQFTRDLKQNKNSAAQSFEGAELRILDGQRFEIMTNNNLEQRFVEQEKRKLSDLLQERFGNKNISFSVSIREQTANQPITEKTWSKREQFHQIADMYPLVKELKDKLKLELDY